MVADFWSQTDLPEFGDLLALSGRFFFLRLFVTEFPVINDSTNRRFGGWRHFYQVYHRLAGDFQRLKRGHHTQLLAFLPDHTYVGNSYLIIDAQ